ncbi:hypothetical protein PR202_ga28295 [Eleusine coracana subsp. coracana]|uniref:Uncharacterized protein n=1 Tax=Eleusine coracana subsp. coracana TaxID=191504 RepID=A0AAV5DI71_ELECO|nr:hypothetical protein PR202_ga28295 [Eleusine coracana subsp. coracana]
MAPLLDLGKRKALDLDDVPFLDDSDSVHGISPKFKSKISSMSATGQHTDVTTVKLVKALVLTTWKLIIITAVYALLRTVTSYVGPYLIQYFVDYLNETPRSSKEGYVLVLAFVVSQLVEGLSSRHLLFRSQQLGIRVRSALIAIIFQKGLALSSHSKQGSSSGELINVVSLDAERVGNFNWSMHELWLLPVQISLAMVILYSTLGLAAFASLAATVLIMLANIPLGRIQRNYQEKTMNGKDARMSSLSEILRNMRILKLQGWELAFLSKVKELRKVEMHWIKKYVYTSSMLISVFFGAPAFVAMITFGTCILLGIPLEAGKVLSALATFKQLQGPIYSLPDTISSIIQTKVSLDRICSFLLLEESASDAVTKLPNGSTDKSIEVRNGRFCWDKSSEVPTLQDLNFSVRQGMRVAICGTVGSGKSSLLSCILGEIPKISGEVQTCGRIAFVSQSPWIQSGTIEENVLFGTKMNRERYKKECLLGFLASKTVLYVTHHVEFLPSADLILVLRDGKITQLGNYQEILRSGDELMEFVVSHKGALSTLNMSERPNVNFDSTYHPGGEGNTLVIAEDKHDDNSEEEIVDNETAGLAVTYGLSLNMLQGWAIAVLCSLENKMISVERILQYANIPSEPPLTLSESRPDCQWPIKGEIELRNLHVRYAPQLPSVLKGLTCTLPGEKKTVMEDGKNWSAGQRQLVCLGRVILKRRKVLVLDEATSSVDPVTDNLIQNTLKVQFPECTVITIAHRITSVLGCDKVLLLDNGEIAEQDTPAKLLEDKSSLFSKLVSEYTMGSDYK